MIQALIPAIAELAGGWLRGKAEEKAATSRVKVARAEAEAEVMRVAATHEAGWERVMAEASKDSWKDEAWTILFIAIIAMWFQWAMYASIAASFGLRGLKGLKK
jgi:uncharacterized membrane protein YqiK